MAPASIGHVSAFASTAQTSKYRVWIVPVIAVVIGKYAWPLAALVITPLISARCTGALGVDSIFSVSTSICRVMPVRSSGPFTPSVVASHLNAMRLVLLRIRMIVLKMSPL